MRPTAAVLLILAVALCGCVTKRVQPKPSPAILQARAHAAALKARPPLKCADAVAMMGTVTVPFAYGEAQVSETGRDLLDEAAQWLICRPAVPVLITGEADAAGAKAIQQTLPQRRIQAVKDYLVYRGVPAGRLLTAKPATGVVLTIEAKGRGW